MRIRFTILAAASLVALFALESCDKSDIISNDIQQQTGGSRVIAVSFQNNSTKTELDGLQPKFEADDIIKVANGTDEPEDCPVSVDGSGNATITTSLTGALTAVYPVSAAKMSGNAIEGVLVPTEQDGTFASANICMAENIAEGATSATFENQTAVFKITPGAGADTKYVEVITAGAEIANCDPEGNYPTLHKIHVVTTSADPVYVSILVPVGLKICNLGFADGYNIKGLKDNTTTIAKNTLYNVDAENWNRPYVEIRGLKWATMNVGATTVAGSASTCYGDYFAWGATEPYYTSISFTSASEATINGWKSGKENGYAWSTAPFNNGSSECDKSYFAEHSSTWLTDIVFIPSYSDDVTTVHVLKPAYDAATANWGSSWRMPTQSEFFSLYDACDGPLYQYKHLSSSTPDGGIYRLTSDQTYLPEYIGLDGTLFVDMEDISKQVFFPAAGRVEGTSFFGCSTVGHYWSGEFGNYATYAYNLLFYDWLIAPCYGHYGRYYGFTVRPFSE